MDGKQHTVFIWLATIVPVLATVAGAVLLWQGAVGWSDLATFVVMYVVCALGVTVGYHRLLAHRSFTASPPVRVGLAVAGTMAAQGPAIIWAAHHRRHHRLTDKPGDPHSPYVTPEGEDHRGLRGWWHSHLGWLLDERLTSNPIRYCPDLAREPSLRWVSRNFAPLVLLGVALPAALGFALTGTLLGAATGALWGGLIRMFVLNQVTYCVNSLGHMTGGRGFATPDESRNTAWLALASFGEAWHNNHHALPRSARFGFRPWQVDLGGSFVAVLERLGLARSVVRFDHDDQEARAQRLAETGGGRAAPSSPPAPMAERRPTEPVGARAGGGDGGRVVGVGAVGVADVD
jgi:stearoyl-CoA desaturase (Delta-9 desaturase)